MKKNNLLFALLCCAPFAASAQFPVLGSTSVSDFRLGPSSGGPNTGVFKWTTANELGIFTWADGKPIRIGGTLVKFQHESGNPNNVYMSGNLGVGVTPSTFKFEVAGNSKFVGNASIQGLVEINSGSSGASGLKFNQLNLGSTASASNGKVLSLNASGDVILTNAAGTTYTAGNGITISGTTINSTWTQSGANISNNNAGNVGVGVAAPSAKLDINSANDYSLRSINSKISTSISTSPIAVYGEAINSVGIGYGGAFKGANTGVYGESEQNLDNLLPEQLGSALFDITGVDGFANNYGTTNSRWAVGVRGQGYANSANATCIGLSGFASGSGASYGVYGDASGSISYAGYFNGDVFRSGTDNFTSDRKLKKNIEPLTEALERVMKLKPTKYEFKTDEYSQMNLPKGTRFGFIAQELEEVFPILVKQSHHPETKDKNGNTLKEAVDFKAVSYTEIIPILTAAIQEQQVQIEELKKMLATTNANNNSTGAGSTTTDGATKGYLSQNVPNPFTQSTVISYQLPANAKTAAIGVYDLNGKELKLFTLGVETAGSVTLDGGSMQPGMYVYTLLVNGMPFETKKMVLTSR